MELNVSYGRGSGHVNFYGEAAFDQLKAHETISGSGANENETSAVPYHAVDYAYVNRGPITSVTPSDDLCGGVDDDCPVYLYQMAGPQLTEVKNKDTLAFANGVSANFYAFNVPNPTMDVQPIAMTAVSSDETIVGIIPSQTNGISISCIDDGTATVTFTFTDAGCSKEITVKVGDSTDR